MSDLIKEYGWLIKRLAKEVGRKKVRPELSNDGKTLILSWGPADNPCFVLAEHIPVRTEEYEIVELNREKDWAQAEEFNRPYSLNSEANRFEEIEKMITKANEAWRKKGGNKNGKVHSPGCGSIEVQLHCGKHDFHVPVFRTAIDIR